MPTADEVVAEFRVKMDRYEADLVRSRRAFDHAIGAQEAKMLSFERQVKASSGQISSSLKGMAGALAASFGAREVATMADSYTRFTNQLKVAGLEGQNLAATQGRLFDVAQQNGVELEAVGTLYSRAAQNQKELGASTEDLIGLTRAVAASLRISGTSTNEASGALMQLGQALGSPRVQAEEFNSLLDTMQPLLREASKYIDGTGGSLAGLTRKIKDTSGPGVSAVELFRAINKAMADLEGQAAATQLTISGAFTNLSNALTKYIGEADQANGASVAVTEGLNALADNLDVVTDAIAVLAAFMIGRFAASMASGVGSSVAFGNALFALQARAGGAATSMEALTFASRGAGAAMLAAFGGPVGLAVTALTLGIGYLAVESGKAEAAAAELTASIQAQTAQFASLRENQARAAAETNNLTDKQQAAITTTANLTGEAGLLANAWARVAAQAKAAAVEQANATLQAARRNVNAARTARQDNIRGIKGLEAYSASPDVIANARKAGEELRQNYVEAAANVRTARQEYDREVARPLSDPKYKPGQAPGVAAGTDKKTGGKKTGGGRGGDVEAAARRFQDEVERGELDIRQAQADAIGTAEARRAIEHDRVEFERASQARAIKADEDLTQAQRDQLLLLNDRVASARREAINADALAEATENAQQLRQDDLRNEQDVLRSQASLADTARERRAIELRLLDLQYEEERIRLSAIADNKRLRDEEREAARRRLESLDKQYGLEREGVVRGTESPLEAYRRKVTRSPDQINEDIEGYVVDELESVQNSITSAITKKIGTKDPLLSSVIDLFIQQVIMKPLAEALSMAGGGFGGGGGLVGILGAIAAPVDPHRPRFVAVGAPFRLCRSIA